MDVMVFFSFCAVSGRKDRKSARADDNTDDDMMSTTSTVSSSDFGGAPETEETGVDESTLMEQFVEALYQKRYVNAFP